MVWFCLIKNPAAVRSQGKYRAKLILEWVSEDLYKEHRAPLSLDLPASVTLMWRHLYGTDPTRASLCRVTVTVFAKQ